MANPAGTETGSRLPILLFRAMLVAVTLLGGFLRFRQLDRFSYWLDEILQAFYVHGSWRQFWASLRFDAVHPPLDYLVCRLVEFLHPADWVRKLPAAFWGTLTIPALGLFVARRAGRVAGLGAAVFLAVAPFHVRYSQELRPYSLAMLLLIVALLVLDRFLDRPAIASGVLLYVSFLAVAYTLYLAALALGIAALALTIGEAIAAPAPRRLNSRRSLMWSPAFVGLLVIGYLPWLPVVRQAAGQVTESAPPPATFTRYASILAFFSSASAEGQGFRLRDISLAALILVGLVVVARRPRERWLPVWILTTSLVIELLEQLHPHFPVPRHFLPVGFGLLALAGIGLSSIWRVNLIAILGVPLVTVLVGLPSLIGLREYYDSGRPDWRRPARYLKEHAVHGRVITENQWIALCLSFYLDGPDSLHTPTKTPFEVIPLPNGDPTPFQWLWRKDRPLWVVTCQCANQSPRVKAFVKRFPGQYFPQAEGATVYLFPNAPR